MTSGIPVQHSYYLSQLIIVWISNIPMNEENERVNIGKSYNINLPVNLRIKIEINRRSS